MAQTFVYVATAAVDFNGRHYEPGESFAASPYDAGLGPLLIRQQVIAAPPEDQRAHGVQPRITTVAPAGVAVSAAVPDVELTVTPRKRGRPRKKVDEPEDGRYQRRDLRAEE